MLASSAPVLPRNPAPIAARPRWLRVATIAASVWLLLAIVIGLVTSRHWPLVNDGALLHYISFMMDGGNAPYRQLLDMDLPGALLLDWSVVHLVGPGPAAWRVFDALLLLAASTAIFAMSRPYSRFAGIFAAALFWLLHLRDGMGQAGQRDLIEAALLLAMVAFTFHAVRAGRPWPFLLAGLCAGVAVTIKPDSLLLAVLILALTLQQLRRTARPILPAALLSTAGFLIPLVAVGVFLLRQHALVAFWTTLTEIIPFYASLGRQSLPALLRDWLSAPLRLLLVATAALAFAHRQRWSWERTVLVAGVVWGLASFLLQGKGFPYHRYPSVAFLLLWCGLTCVEALRRSGWPRILGAVALLYGTLVIAPLSLTRAVHATWTNALLDALQSDLTKLHDGRLDGSVQCIDSIVGCNTVLLRLQLHQQTGMLSDFLIFGPDTVPAIRRTRETFWQQIATRPPRVIVVTGALHPGPPDTRPFVKLDTWPAFAAFLDTRYTLATERSFAPGMNGPLAYRIYTLR